MNEGSRLARRYHWHSAAVRDFTADPHTGIVGVNAGTIRNLVDRRARPAQDALLAIAQDDPARTLATVRRLQMPGHHEVRAGDVNDRRLGAVLALAHERELRDFASLLLLEQLGPRTLQSLALVAEVVHGTPTRFDDPARFSFAHGGKDGHPFPVPLHVYDETLDVLRKSARRVQGRAAPTNLTAWRGSTPSREPSSETVRQAPMWKRSSHESARPPRASAAEPCSMILRLAGHGRRRRGDN